MKATLADLCGLIKRVFAALLVTLPMSAMNKLAPTENCSAASGCGSLSNALCRSDRALPTH
jgi:hypothetical protein